jgi:diguanylate cyclase (GGDEF)-like protein
MSDQGDDTRSGPGGLAEAPPRSWPDPAGSAVVALELRRRAPGEGPLIELPSRLEVTLKTLVVDDCEDEFALVRDLLGRAEETRFLAEWAPTFEAGLRRLAVGGLDACIVDSRLAGGDGLEFLRLALRRGFETPIIVVTGDGDRRIDLEAIELGAADFLDKEEYDVERLERALRFALTRRRTAERLGRLAQYDELTGLANRSLMLDRLDRALAAARRHRGHVAVMLLDLNGFKAVNDRLGHGAGDRLLRIVADRLSRRLRETDTVARLGGDEFAVIVESLGKPEHASLVARKLLEAVAPPIALDGETVSVTASLGVALSPRDGDDPATLLRLADAAMYRAKAQGGNRCRFHDEAVDSRMRRGVLLEQDLRRALEREEFVLHFQPQVTLRPGELGLASLVRWRHPELGVVDADRFRSLAEDTGLLEPLTDWLLGAASAQIRRWHEMGLHALHVAVPILSRRQLAWSPLARRVAEQLERDGVDPGSLELEIDEHLLLEELEAAGATLPALRELGVRLAVAGFGSGSTSLMLLRDAPLRTLKLARALLEGTPKDMHRGLFVAAIIRLARQLGLRIVAEGVESQAQLQMLRREGCDAVQAFMSCPPLPADACTDWLHKAAQRR